MADGKYFLLKLKEIFENDDEIQALNKTKGVKAEISEFAPVGNTYPQITMDLDDGKSETVFPAGHHMLTITVSVKKQSIEPYATIKTIVKRVNALINRKASSISEIDLDNNEGLRVARCVKQGGTITFDKETGLYNDDIMFDCVISEGEDFSDETAGNKAWQ